MDVYEYRHIVGFAETNLVGNAYYVHYLHWQGRCREMFLREHCPELVEALSRDLALVTTRCTCDYLAELVAFDEVSVRMRLAEMSQNRITMLFEYYRVRDDGEQLVARGEQQVASMRREGSRMTPAPLPPALREALELYSDRSWPLGARKNLSSIRVRCSSSPRVGAAFAGRIRWGGQRHERTIFERRFS